MLRVNCLGGLPSFSSSRKCKLDNEQKDYIILEGSNGETIYYLRAWDGEESSIMWVNQDKTIDYRD